MAGAPGRRRALGGMGVAGQAGPAGCGGEGWGRPRESCVSGCCGGPAEGAEAGRDWSVLSSCMESVGEKEELGEGRGREGRTRIIFCKV